MANSPDLLTIGDIYQGIKPEFPDVRLHQVKYAVDRYEIRPRQRAGIVRLWHRDQLPDIAAALRRTAAQRQGVAVA